ncbi:MAG: hypothetical protein JSS94_08975 [Bacteroidetes bacterium]|nr:hypothetical protein [Bacteroidota bacterium]
MEHIIRFILSNFTLTFVVIGLVFSLISIYRNKLTKDFVIEAILKYYFFWGYGVSWTYNAIMHIFFHESAASFIGWDDSPFQLEVGFASLGMGLLGLLCIKKNFSLRLALLICSTPFLWGAAGVHIQEIIEKQNYASGNAGIMLWSGILMPVFSFVLLYLSNSFNKSYER